MNAYEFEQLLNNEFKDKSFNPDNINDVHRFITQACASVASRKYKDILWSKNFSTIWRDGEIYVSMVYTEDSPIVFHEPSMEFMKVGLHRKKDANGAGLTVWDNFSVDISSISGCDNLERVFDTIYPALRCAYASEAADTKLAYKLLAAVSLTSNSTTLSHILTNIQHYKNQIEAKLAE